MSVGHFTSDIRVNVNGKLIVPVYKFKTGEWRVEGYGNTPSPEQWELIQLLDKYNKKAKHYHKWAKVAYTKPKANRIYLPPEIDIGKLERIINLCIDKCNVWALLPEVYETDPSGYRRAGSSSFHMKTWFVLSQHPKIGTYVKLFV